MPGWGLECCLPSLVSLALGVERVTVLLGWTWGCCGAFDALCVCFLVLPPRRLLVVWCPYASRYPASWGREL